MLLRINNDSFPLVSHHACVLPATVLSDQYHCFCAHFCGIPFHWMHHDGSKSCCDVFSGVSLVQLAGVSSVSTQQNNLTVSIITCVWFSCRQVYCSATLQSNPKKSTAHARTLVGRQKGRWFCTCQCWCYHTGVFVRAKILKTRVRMVNSGPWQQCLTACHTMLYTTAKTREQKLVLHGPKKYWACCFFPTWLSARDGRDLLTHSLQKAQESVFS